MLLNVPLPDEIDHAPVLAPPPILAPVKAKGVEDLHSASGPPGVRVAAAFTVMTTVLTAAAHGPAPSGSFVVSVNVAVPDDIDGV